ncbi:MAG TPA: SseB family protein, partial [Polyangiales bacterium]|nr:SseB family protein [Polyangiales bacterium]
MGEFRIDHATIAFRLALAEASEQEQARVDALMALWQRSVFAATWPSPNEAPRTLTNSHGETALPLFSGLDTLEVGADRFSWREANGSIRYREMPAHEALRYALTRQVNFVVLDVGFEHNVEFAREEFEPLIAQREPSPSASAAVLDAIRRNSRPPTASPPPASAPPDPASLRAQVAAQPPSTRAVPGASRPAAPSAAQAPAPLSGGPDRPSGAPTAASPQAQARSRSAAASPRSSHAAIPQRRTTAPWPQYPSEPAGPPQPQAAAPQPEPQRAVTPPPARPTSAAVPAQPEAAPPQRTATPAPARPTTAAVPVQPGAAS